MIFPDDGRRCGRLSEAAAHHGGTFLKSSRRDPYAIGMWGRNKLRLVIGNLVFEELSDGENRKPFCIP